VCVRECEQPECLSTRRNRKPPGEHASSAALRAPSGATTQEIRVKRFAMRRVGRRRGGGGGREGEPRQRKICINDPEEASARYRAQQGLDSRFRKSPRMWQTCIQVRPTVIAARLEVSAVLIYDSPISECDSECRMRDCFGFLSCWLSWKKPGFLLLVAGGFEARCLIGSLIGKPLPRIDDEFCSLALNWYANSASETNTICVRRIDVE